MTNLLPQWRCVGCSVRGASHIRSQFPNQDAIAWHSTDSESGTPLILAIADGHGSAKSFRSDIGSKLAVKTSIQLMHEFFIEGKPRLDADLKAAKDIAYNLFPQRLVHEWSIVVQNHLQSHPFSEDESGWQRLSNKEKETAKSEIEHNPNLAYGTTLITILITDTFILYTQLGDGDIVCIDAQGTVTRPMPVDPKLIGNETTSLCTPNAWKEFRIALEDYSSGRFETAPALILAATDGYANSFSSESEFLKIAPDYLEMTREGFQAAASQLPEFLKETSIQGSGDDITLGLIKRWEPTKDIADALYAMKIQQDQQSKAARQLEEQQKKTSKALFYTLIGFATMSILTIAMLPISYWFWVTRPALEKKAEEQQQAFEKLQRQVETLESSTKPSVKESKPQEKQKHESS